MTNCDRTGCENPGTHHPVLLILPEGQLDRRPMEFALGLKVCRVHQETTTVADLIHPEDGYTYLDQIVQTMFGAKVDRESVGVVWRAVGSLPFPPRQQT